MNKLGRNDPCHCGSGKKYKACCLVKDNEQERAALTLPTSPLLVDGESKAECGELTMHCDGELISIIRNRVTPNDNHIHGLANGFDLQSCVLSRTSAGGEKYQQPEHAAKGFTWYLRLSPKCGGGIVAYFKDINDAMEALDYFAQAEMNDASDFGLPSNKDLEDMRQSLIIFGWPLLPEL